MLVLAKLNKYMNFSFKSLFDNMLKPEVRVDPAIFNDPLALKTSWNPLQGGGASFRTHEAVQASANRIEFRATPFSYVMLMIPVTFTFLFPILLIGRNLSENGGLVLNRDSFWGVAIAVICGFVSVFGYRYIQGSIIFDRSYGYFWKGKRNKIGEAFDPAQQKESVRLGEVHALQIIHEWISGSGKRSRPYKSYELNLVLRSGERMNVVDHGNKKRLLEDANQLAQFLNVPVWDGSANMLM